MMKTTYKLAEISRQDSGVFGGKAAALRGMQQAGILVPATLCIPTDAYKRFVGQSGLKEKIELELHRKKFSDMRWEEIWDAALRLRSLFLRYSMPEKLAREMRRSITENFDDKSVVVRSSAPEEDTAATSFAGLHESFVNIRGTEAILDHVKLVWASLWSDRALLYRQELGLDISRSSMAVVVQELVEGEVSGVVFSVNPADAAEGVVEAVYGLNQGLVDGAVEPDRWILERHKETIKEHVAPMREKTMRASGESVTLVDLPKKKAAQAPLTPDGVVSIYGMAMKIERIAGKPQGVEWTKLGSEFIILQARPVTARQDGDAGEDDKRGWYLSLQRSEDNLTKLRKKIEQVHFPAMTDEAAELAKKDLQHLGNEELAYEIENRKKIKEKWTAVYWEDFIPFAHGMRLFGKFYNDTMSPADPFEFVALLSKAPLLSKERNLALQRISAYVQQHPVLRQSIEAGTTNPTDDAELTRQLDEFIRQFGDPFCGTYNDKTCDVGRNELLSVIMQMSDQGATVQEQRDNKEENKADLESAFLERFHVGESRSRSERLLDLGRASYRLRDDDNILLGRIEEEYSRGLQEGRRRLKDRFGNSAGIIDEGEIVRCLVDEQYKPRVSDIKVTQPEKDDRYVKARQLLGQPAGPGIARGIARVVGSTSDLAHFQKGEVLVCDAVDPNMTFIVPLAAGIIERRGGMLIHGAIIAREYGIACVTGVPDAATLIHTGDEVTVDGYLGIVTIGSFTEQAGAID
jgi:pyruvate,water dikinase